MTKINFPNAIEIANRLLPLIETLDFSFIRETLLKEKACDIFLSLSTSGVKTETRVFKISVEVV